jgi:hypothetical protein
LVTLAPQHQGLVEADWFKGEWTTARIYALLRSEFKRG